MNAMDAAGRSVFFAACTVILALLGLVALGLGALQGMALSAALTVLVTMLASLTLLPALLGIFGRRFARQFTRRAQRRKAKGKADDGAGWRRLAAAVQRRPLAALLAGTVLVGALAFPALDVRLGFSDAGSDARPTAPAEQAYDLLSDGFGPGFNGPLLVVTDGGSDAAAQAAQSAPRHPGRPGRRGPDANTGRRGRDSSRLPHHLAAGREDLRLVGTLRDDVLPSCQRRTARGTWSAGPRPRQRTTPARSATGCRCSSPSSSASRFCC